MIADIASIATAAGVVAAVIQLLLSRRQPRAAFEHEFVKRYWLIGDDSMQQPAMKAGDVERQRYLRLCEDEFEVMRLGAISWRTWEVWHDAIREGVVSYADWLGTYSWSSTCWQSGDHAGSDCPGIFLSGAGVHSSHLSARWPSSLGRAWFLVVSACRRIVYVRGARIWRLRGRS